MNKLNIIIPTLYLGGIKPKEIRYGDIFYNDYEGKFYLYLDKWFQIFRVEETGYTSEQTVKMEEKKKQEETKKDKELKEYRDMIVMLKKLLK